MAKNRNKTRLIHEAGAGRLHRVTLRLTLARSPQVVPAALGPRADDGICAVMGHGESPRLPARPALPSRLCVCLWWHRPAMKNKRITD